MRQINSLRRMLPILLTALLLLTISTPVIAPVSFPMSIYGTVYIDGEPATAGYHIYAKVGTQIVDLVEGSDDITDENGEYTIGIGPESGLDDGISIDIWVEDCECVTITLEYDSIPLEQDLTYTVVIPETGTLNIDTTPVKGAVLVDGVSLGDAPVSQEFDVGTYMVSYGDVEGYTTPIDEEATVTKDTTTEIEGTYVLIPVEPDTGTLSVTTTPVDGEVFVNEESWGTAPASQEVEVGDYTVSYGDMPGYTTPIDEEATVTKDTTTEIEGTYVWIPVEPDTGTLSVTTTPVDGEVFVDGVSLGDAPVSQEFDVGTYMVSYGDVEGYTTPIDEEAEVTKDTTTDIEGTYVWIPPTPTGDFSIDYVTPGDAVYGDKLTVIGSGVTSGSTVNVYWNYVTAANLLNVTTGLPSGEFECTVKVPSAYYGNHYIWAKDLSSGISIRSDAISVVSKVKLSPSSGLEGDDIVVKGYGFSWDVDVSITFGGLADGIGEDETDDLGYFEYTFEVEATEYKDYTVTAVDEDLHSAEADFTLGASLTIDKDVGPAGTIAKVEFRGFTPKTEINTEVDITMDGVPVSTRDGKNVTASKTGTGTVYVVIPSVEEGDYEITIDDGVKVATSDFEVDGETSITVTPGYGTPGATLTIKGYNFTQISGTDVELTLMQQEAEAETDSNGEFTATITIPPLDFGERYTVTATDARLCTAEDEVLVAMIVLQLSELTGPVGSKVTLMGSGFTLDGDWNATFSDTDLIIDLIEDTSTSKDTTYFSYTWYVPSVPSGTYTVNVLDIEEEIEVGIVYTVTEQASLTANRVAIPNTYNLTLEGVNFVEAEGFATTWWIYNSTDAWEIDDNVTYGGEIPVTDEDGELTGYYQIPTFLALGSYTINCTTISESLKDSDVIQTAEADIEIVPEEIVINVGAPSYARGQTITFVIKATLQKDPFDLGIKDPEGGEVFNSTWDLDDWKILGTWYYIPSNLQIDKNTAWLYTLPADAMAGTWTYSFWDDDKEYANGTFYVTEMSEIEQLQYDLGEVIAGIEGLGTSSTDLAALVADLQGASAEAVAAAAAAAAAAAEAQAAAEAGMEAISDVEDTSNEALIAANDAKEAADKAKDAADAGLQAAMDSLAKAQQSVDAANDAKEAAEGNQQQTSGLTSLVYGAIAASLIAALAAIVSLMQISKRIAG